MNLNSIIPLSQAKRNRRCFKLVFLDINCLMICFKGINLILLATFRFPWTRFLQHSQRHLTKSFEQSFRKLFCKSLLESRRSFPQSNSHTFLARILQKWYISDTICKNLARILDFRQTCQILADQTFLAD